MKGMPIQMFQVIIKKNKLKRVESSYLPIPQRIVLPFTKNPIRDQESLKHTNSLAVRG